MRKWREIDSLHFLILSLFPPSFSIPPSLSISYIKMHHILLQNVKYGTFVANVTKNTQHTRYEEIILGRTCCEEAPQFVPACSALNMMFVVGNMVIVLSSSISITIIIIIISMKSS